MIYYRCKCGYSESWGSMPPYPCSGCENCNTTLEVDSRSHKKPENHEFIPYKVETDTGLSTIHRCKWCNKTKTEI